MDGVIPRTRSARWAALYVTSLASLTACLLLDVTTVRDAESEPATVIGGKYHMPTDTSKGGGWVTVKTEAGETLTAMRAPGLPPLDPGSRVTLVTRRGVVGVVVRREVR